jgi:predicted solute-binding protein
MSPWPKRVIVRVGFLWYGRFNLPFVFALIGSQIANAARNSAYSRLRHDERHYD